MTPRLAPVAVVALKFSSQSVRQAAVNAAQRNLALFVLWCGSRLRALLHSSDTDVA